MKTHHPFNSALRRQHAFKHLTLALTLSVLACLVAAKALAADTNLVPYTATSSNLISISNAVRIASGLRLGMSETEVQKYMHAHGMTNEWEGQTKMFSISVDRGDTLNCPYFLAGGATLWLEMHSTKPPPSGQFGRSAPLFSKATIQTSDDHIIPIAPTNAP